MAGRHDCLVRKAKPTGYKAHGFVKSVLDMTCKIWVW
jgi:hypothetical protein